MRQLTYLKTNSTAHSGIDFIRKIVHDHNCIFQEIDQRNDLGIDAIIEIIKDEKPTSRFFATQIKSGKSYFDKKENLCKIPVKNHKEYWLNHPLPVYGIVFIPELGDAYWIDIKKYLKQNQDDTIIYFEKTLANQINEASFIKIFIPRLLNETPNIDFDFAVKLFSSDKSDEFFLGLHTLFSRFAFKNEMWALFIDYFKVQPVENIPLILIYYLAHLPWHPDISYFKGTLTQEAEDFGKSLIRLFDRDQIIKLLTFVDEEMRISRGSIGQSIEAIISIIPNFKQTLASIIKDNKQDIVVRESAALIFAYHAGKESIPILETVPTSESWYIYEIIKHITEFGEIDPYL